MDEKINPQDLAEILGVSRQYVYASNKNEWGVDDIEDYADGIIAEAREKAGAIKTRLNEYIKSIRIDESGYTITEADRKRFMRKVEKDDSGCWLWVAGKAAHGYGQFRFRHKQMGAHRFSYWMHTGEYPGDQYVCHSCNTKNCVNPEHLFLGNQQDNMDHLKDYREENGHDYKTPKEQREAVNARYQESKQL